MNLSLVVLAAGASRRFGAANKLLQLLDGKPLLCHTLELAAALPVMQRAAVCSVETAPLAEAAGFTVLLNPQPELGQSHSLRLGLAACRESDGCLFLTGDQPFLSVETLHRLINAWEKEPGGIWGCEFEGRFSIPSIFPAAVYGELLTQDGDDGRSCGPTQSWCIPSLRPRRSILISIPWRIWLRHSKNNREGAAGGLFLFSAPYPLSCKNTPVLADGGLLCKTR